MAIGSCLAWRLFLVSLSRACSHRQDPRKGYFQLVRFKSKGAGLALVSNAALGVDQVDPIRPPCIRLFRRVAKVVENGWKFDSKFSHTRPGDKGAPLFIFRAAENNCIFYIALHLPHVAGMRFVDIDDQESDAIAILLIKFIERGNLPPERRSGIATENKHDRLALI
jgi:hypothetical protein